MFQVTGYKTAGLQLPVDSLQGKTSISDAVAAGLSLRPIE
jgi:hypothetical protein